MAGRFRLHGKAARSRGEHSPSDDRPFYSDEHSNAEEIRGNEHHGAVAAHHHLHVGLVVGHAGARRADKPPRVQAHRGRTHEDSAISRLEPHDISGNKPASEVLSRQSDGNIASRKGGREEWSHYAHERSHTRDKQNAAISGRGARGRHCTGYLAIA